MPDDISAIMSEHPVGRRTVDVGPAELEQDYFVWRHEALDAISAMGPVAYAIRYGELFKLGWTTNLRQRLKQLNRLAGHESAKIELIAFRFMDTQAEEVEMHRTLAASAHHGREWYNPTPDVLAVINDWRDQLGRDPIAA